MFYLVGSFRKREWREAVFILVYCVEFEYISADIDVVDTF